MALELRWMQPQAPYMPIATVGLLDVLKRSGDEARACWQGSDRDGSQVLSIETELDPAAVAERISTAPRPSLDRVDWPSGKPSQGLKPTLKDANGKPALVFRELLTGADPLEARMLRAIATDAVLDNDGIPARSRLFRGVKADLSTFGASPGRDNPDDLLQELEEGPRFSSGKSGSGWGLVPEVQTFGGTTGPDASTVNASSTLLYLLLLHGLLALPPVAVRRGPRRVVGGPLVTAPDSISWPVWGFPVDSAGLRSLFSFPEIHAEAPRAERLASLGIGAVYRSRTVQLSTMVAVFRWGERVAG